jgi:hypothetical protein
VHEPHAANTPDPADPALLNAQLRQASRRGERLVWWLVIAQSVLIGCLIAAVIYLLVSNAHAQDNQRQLQQTQQAQIQRALTAADQRWCSTIQLLTAQPVAKPNNPAANPARESQYKFYQDFLTLKKEFHCK